MNLEAVTLKLLLHETDKEKALKTYAELKPDYFSNTFRPILHNIKDFYDKEILKIYDATGWDPTQQAYVNEPKPVKWVRIHNLPDFVYFNHSQHVEVAGVDCQKCHGEIQEMEIVEQHAPLTMGWCINCHRETDVNLKGNAYYEKIHEQLKEKYGVESFKASQMGALECGKCHY